MITPEPVLIENSGTGVAVVPQLKQRLAIGFSGQVRGGLVCDGSRAFYPLGKTIVARSIGSGKQTFLTGHNYLVSCLALSSSGRYLVSGEAHEIGSKVTVTIWDTCALRPVGDYTVHHAAVSAVAVSPDERFVVSAGGPDDLTFLLWDLKAGRMMCAGRKTYGRPFSTKSMVFTSNTSFLCGGQDALQTWTIEPEAKRITPKLVSLGKLKRNISCLMVYSAVFVRRPATDGVDEVDYVFCGTDSGDIVKVYLRRDGEPVIVGCIVKRGTKAPTVQERKFAGGVHCLLEKKGNEFLVGSGDGSLTLVQDRTDRLPTKKTTVDIGAPTKIQEPTKSGLLVVKTVQLSGAVTSLAKLDDRTVLAGCASGDVFQVDLLTFATSVLSTCHTNTINDVAFPRGCDQIFATCGNDGIRVWDIDSGLQYFHIKHPGGTCLAFHPDGSYVLSGWADGCLRAFTPQSGRLLYQVPGVHSPGVTALALLRDRILTGGRNGQMRSWTLGYGNAKPKLVATVQEHKGEIVGVEVTRDETECITGSKDGSCIIWDVRRPDSISRKRILNGTAALVGVRYHSSECQILTLASDAQVSYWEVLDGAEVRHLILGQHSSATALDMAPDGEKFVTGTQTSLVKVWRYKRGDISELGKAQCGPIGKVSFSPNARFIVAVTTHGAIIVWDFKE